MPIKMILIIVSVSVMFINTYVYIIALVYIDIYELGNTLMGYFYVYLNKVMHIHTRYMLSIYQESGANIQIYIYF
jgi:hypothetical protein